MDWKRLILLNSLVAAAYYVTAWLLLPLAMMPVNVIPVWLPAGIAMAAVLIWGYRLLPAAFIGDFLVGWQIYIPVDVNGWWLCVLLGSQALLQAWLGRFLLEKFAVWPSALKTDSDIVRFFLLAGLIAALPPALLSAGLQSYFGVLPSTDLWQTLLIWWLGGALGVVILTPIILIFLGQPSSEWRYRRFSVAVPMLLLLALLLVIFWQTKQHEVEVSQQRFEANAKLAHSLVEKELDFHALLLQSMRSYFLHSEEVTFAEFSAYLADFSQHRHDVTAALWIEKNTIDSQTPYWLRYIKPVKQSNKVLPSLAGRAMCQSAGDRKLCDEVWRSPASLKVSPVFTDLTAELPGEFMFLLGVRDGVGPLSGLVVHIFDYDNFFAPLAASEVSHWVEFSVIGSHKGAPLFQTAGFNQQSSQMPNLHLDEVLDNNLTWHFQYQPSAYYLQTYQSWSVFGIIISALILFSFISAWLMSQSGRVLQIREAVNEKTQALEQNFHLLRKSEEKYRRLIENIKDEYVLYSHDVNGVFTYVSPSVKSILGYHHTELLHHYDNYLPDTEINRKVAGYTRQTLSGKTMAYEVEMLDKFGKVHLLAVKEMPAYNERGEIIGVEGILHDITALKKSQLMLEKLSLAVKHSPNAIIIMDRDGIIEYVNPKFTAITGYHAEEAVGKWPDLINAGDDPQALHDEMWQTILAGQEWRGEVQNRKKNGDLYWAQELIAPMLDANGRVSHVVATQVDITEARRLNEETSYQASHDLLTGLINRREFDLRLHRVIESSRLDHGEHALCFMDLDQFKVINDTCGHIAGDELLRQVGALLQANIRSRDTIARLGGDEFVILMEHCSIEQAFKACEGVLGLLQDFRFYWEGYSFTIGASIGLTVVDVHTKDVTEAMRNVDNACYVAKDAGRNRVEVHTEDSALLKQRRGEIQWSAEINEALDEDRFLLYVQPIVPVNPENGALSYEILLRLRRRDGSLSPPGAFLPAAERYNSITRIDRWVVNKTFDWLSQNVTAINHIDSLSINLSGLTLSDENMLNYIHDAVVALPVATGKICFEITETAAIANLLAATVFIERLGSLGVRFALDDFGSGLSSFGYLKKLRVDSLKIDGMFVKDMLNDPLDLEMVKSINEIGHVMGLNTIAEFVESPAILHKLREIGVDYAQGYSIGVPVPIETLLSAGQTTSN
ncbi:MAG: EAL domain-containing protein [Methylophaga sp.]|nr:EAL domain-containing protein [Methylophaga sp.]